MFSIRTGEDLNVRGLEATVSSRPGSAMESGNGPQVPQFLGPV